MKPVLERLLAKIEIREGVEWAGSACWIFTGSRTHPEHGYGQIGVNGVKKLAHRVTYEEMIGPIPEGLTLDHLCRRRLCCNPWHVEPVTHRENVLRGVSYCATAAAKTHCPAGHELAGDNLNKSLLRRRGARSCMICKREQQRTYWRVNREAIRGKQREYMRRRRAQ